MTASLVSRRVLLLVLALAALTGCGKSGDSRLAGLSTYEAADGTFLIRYRKPPWRFLADDDTGAYFEVLREGAKFTDLDAGLLPVTRKYFLRARVVTAPPDTCITDRLAEKPEGQPVLEGPDLFLTTAGNEGKTATYRYFEDAEMYVSRYVRIACLEHPAGSLELYFDSIPDPREREIDEMIMDVEIVSP